MPYNPLEWRVLNTAVDPQCSTVSTLSLVTWSEREDPHWFGARIDQEGLTPNERAAFILAQRAAVMP